MILLSYQTKEKRGNILQLMTIIFCIGTFYLNSGGKPVKVTTANANYDFRKKQNKLKR